MSKKNKSNRIMNNTELSLVNEYTDFASFDLPPSQVAEEKSKWTVRMSERASKLLLNSSGTSDLWFVDFEDTELDNQYDLCYSRHYNISQLLDGKQSINAVRNNFAMLRNLSYKRLITFQLMGSDFRLAKVYQLNYSNDEIPEIDEYSFFLIVKQIIEYCGMRYYNEEMSGMSFPALPAHRSNNELNNIVSAISVQNLPLSITNKELDRFKCWIISPLPISFLFDYENKKPIFFWEKQSCDIYRMSDDELDAMVDEKFCNLVNEYSMAYKSLFNYIGKNNPRILQNISDLFHVLSVR